MTALLDMTGLRWGVVGATSKIYRNALLPAFAAGERHEVVAEASRISADEAPYTALLQRGDVDALYIPLPNSSHKRWILAALDAGKHVLCEKPLTLSVADTIECFDAADSAGRVLMEAYMWPHHPRAQRVLHLVAGGAIGELRSVRSVFTYPANDPTNHRFDERGAGALFDVGIYCIAPAMLMTGRDHQRVAATAVRNHLAVDVAMTGFVDWGHGAGSSFDVSFEAPQRKLLEVSGTTGVITLPGDHAPGPTGPSQILVQRRDGTVETLELAGANAFIGMVDQFADVVAGLAEAVFGRTESVRLARVLEALHAASS